MACVVFKKAIVCLRPGETFTEEERRLVEKYIAGVIRRAVKRKPRRGKRRVLAAEPEYGHSRVVDTRAVQVGTYRSGAFTDKVFEYQDKRAGRLVRIHFYNGHIMMEQLP